MITGRFKTFSFVLPFSPPPYLNRLVLYTPAHCPPTAPPGVSTIGEMHSISCMAVVVYDDRPPHPYNAGTEHVGFSLTRRTLLAPSAKRREVEGEPHEG